MNWIERRDREDSGIPEFWNLFAIDIEQLAKSFGASRFGRDQKLMAIVTRKNSCLHILRSKTDTTLPQRSIDLCLNEDRRRVFSRIDGEEQSFLRIGLDGDCNVCLLDAEDNPMTSDQASKFFLEEFFFAAR